MTRSGWRGSSITWYLALAFGIAMTAGIALFHTTELVPLSRRDWTISARSLDPGFVSRVATGVPVLSHLTWSPRPLAASARVARTPVGAASTIRTTPAIASAWNVPKM